MQKRSNTAYPYTCTKKPVNTPRGRGNLFRLVYQENILWEDTQSERPIAEAWLRPEKRVQLPRVQGWSNTSSPKPQRKHLADSVGLQDSWLILDKKSPAGTDLNIYLTHCKNQAEIRCNFLQYIGRPKQVVFQLNSKGMMSLYLSRPLCTG